MENSHPREVHSTKVEEHSPDEEDHNRRQRKPENEDLPLLKLKLNEMIDQRFLDFAHRKLLSYRIILCFMSFFMN